MKRWTTKTRVELLQDGRRTEGLEEDPEERGRGQDAWGGGIAWEGGGRMGGGVGAIGSPAWPCHPQGQIPRVRL